MKRRNFLPIVTMAILAVCLTFVLAACGGKKSKAPITYIVTYDANGGTGPVPAGGAYEAGAIVTVASNTFTYAGHSFIGWKAGETAYRAADTFVMPARNVTLKAQWQVIQDPPPEEPPVDPSTEVSEWVEYSGSATLYTSEESVTIVWIRMDVNGVDPTVTYKLEDDATEYVAQANPDDDCEYGLGYILTGLTLASAHDLRVCLKINEDNSLTIYEVGTYVAAGTLTVGGAKKPEPVVYTVSYAFSVRLDEAEKVVGTLPPSVETEVGGIVVIPTVDWTMSGRFIDYWLVQYYDALEDSWCAVPGIGSLQSGDIFLMPAIAVRVAPVWASDADDETEITASEFAELVGVWSTAPDADKHSITVIAGTGTDGILGYAVLDGRTFLAIYERDGTLAASNSADGSEYAFAFSNGAFILRETNGRAAQEEVYRFPRKEAVSSAPESDFIGRWTGSTAQKVLIAADGVAYRADAGIVTEEWLIVGEYLVLSHASSGNCGAYYLLTKVDAGLTGLILTSEGGRVETQFTANGFFVLTVEGEMTQFVGEGSKPTAIDVPSAPEGKLFAGWMIAGSDVPFDFDEVMTADACIEARFEDESNSSGHLLVFTGEWTKSGKTLTEIAIDTDNCTVTLTVNGVKGAAISYSVTAGNLCFYDECFSGEWLFLYINGAALEIGDFLYGDSMTVHYATFTLQ